MSWIRVQKIHQCAEISFDNSSEPVEENKCGFCKSHKNHVHYDNDNTFTIEIYE